jgi:hypothetical protein
MRPGIERIVWITAVGLAWAYVAARAALVPLIHDEAATFQVYVLSGEFLPGSAHWDAGNHLLATAAGRLCYLLLGPSPFALRLFAVLAFGLWAWYAWRITRGLRAGHLRMAAAFALLLMPFALEFFALFRGYGPALALLLMALHHALAFQRWARRSDLLLALLGGTLSVAASLTVLPLTGLLLLACALTVWRRRRRDAAAWLALLLLGAVPFAAFARYGAALSERGLLYYGSPDGIVRGTLASLGEWVLGIQAALLGAALLMAPALLGAIALRTSAHRAALAVLLLLFAGELAGRWLLGTAFGVLYPIDRTAMHLVPVAILLLAHAADAAPAAWRAWAAAGALGLLPLRALMHANLNRTSYWPEQSLTAPLIAAALERQRAADRPLLVGGYHQNACVWAFASMRHGAALNPLDAEGFPQTDCELLLLDPGHFSAPEGFAPIAQAAHGRAVLYAREQPLRTELALDSALARVEGDPEYHDLPAPSPGAVASGTWLVELDARFRSDAPVQDLRLVAELKDAQGTLLHYEATDLARIQPRATGDRLRIVRRLPRCAEPPGRVAVYLWNPKRQAYRADSLRLRLHRVAH